MSTAKSVNLKPSFFFQTHHLNAGASFMRHITERKDLMGGKKKDHAVVKLLAGSACITIVARLTNYCKLF